MKGQLVGTFQLIFVVLAGLAFLTMLFLVARGCAQQGEERLQGLAVDEAARRIEAALWQPESTFNMTIQPSELRCPAGTLTLTTEFASASIDRAPVFLPPFIEGNLQVSVREVLLSHAVAPSIPLGTVLYGLDKETYYLLIRDARGEFRLREVVGSHPNIRTLLVTELEDPDRIRELVPSTARTVVLVAEHNEGYVTAADISLLDERHAVKGVALTTLGAAFYEREDGEMVKRSVIPAEQREMQAAAVVSTDVTSYRCGRQAFSDRLRHVTTLYRERAGDVRADPLLSAACRSTYGTVITTLDELNAEEDEQYMTLLFLLDDRLIQLQEALLRQSCPVIA